MYDILSFFLSILPGILIIIYIYKKDKYEKEPKQFIIKCVFLGAISAIPAVYGTVFLDSLIWVDDPWNSSDTLVLLVRAFVSVAFSEEFAKFIFLLLYMYPKSEFNEPMDGIVYAVAIGMGFAIFENIIYVYEGGISVALLRMFTVVPVHAAFGVIIGYYVGLAKFEKDNSKTILLMIKGVLYAALVHGAYDFFWFSDNTLGLAVLAFVVLIIAIAMSSKLINMHVENSPFKGKQSSVDFDDHLVDD